MSIYIYIICMDLLLRYLSFEGSAFRRFVLVHLASPPWHRRSWFGTSVRHFAASSWATRLVKAARRRRWELKN